MTQLSKILVLVDPELQPSTAMTRAVALAEKSGAELLLVLIDHNDALVRARFLDRDAMRAAVQNYLRQRHDQLQAYADQHATGIDTVKVMAVWAKPLYQEVARIVLKYEPELVLKDVDTQSGVAKLLFTPQDWHLLRSCPVPLMFVSEHASTVPKRVVVAVDPFDTHDKPHALNGKLVNYALGFAKQCEAQVDIAHVAEYLTPNVPLGAEVVFNDAKLMNETREEHRRALESFGESFNVPVDRMHLLEGAPESALAEFCNQQLTDLLVMGTVHREGLERLLIGSTAERILGDVACDIMAIKPDGFDAIVREQLDQAHSDPDEPEPWKEFRRFSL